MPTNQNTQWTDAQDALLRQLALTKRVSIIAAGLKRSAAVKGRASILGVSLKQHRHRRATGETE
jgi:hypothetical protein